MARPFTAFIIVAFAAVILILMPQTASAQLEPVCEICETCDLADAAPGDECYKVRDRSPYWCQTKKNWLVIFKGKCVTEFFDNGCCGGKTKPKGGTCLECEHGCELANQPGGFCGDKTHFVKGVPHTTPADPDRPYRCRKNNWFDECVPYGHDNGCCGDLSCAERYGEKDQDDDCIPDIVDNCPKIPNEDQNDTDFDCHGDPCDEDIDNDGLTNAQEGDTMEPFLQYDYVAHVDAILFGDDSPRYGDLDASGTIDPHTASRTLMSECDTDGDGIPDGIDEAFRDVIDVLRVALGYVAAFFLVLNGTKWITADDPKSKAGAKAGFLYIILGLIIFMITEPLVGYLLTSSGSTCNPNPAVSCFPSGEETKIVFPKNRSVFPPGESVLFVAQTERGRKPKSYEWRDKWICKAPCTDGEAVIGTLPFFTNKSLVPNAKHIINLTVEYERTNLLKFLGRGDKSYAQVIIGTTS